MSASTPAITRRETMVLLAAGGAALLLGFSLPESAIASSDDAAPSVDELLESMGRIDPAGYAKLDSGAIEVLRTSARDDLIVDESAAGHIVVALKPSDFVAAFFPREGMRVSEFDIEYWRDGELRYRDASGKPGDDARNGYVKAYLGRPPVAFAGRYDVEITAHARAGSEELRAHAVLKDADFAAFGEIIGDDSPLAGYYAEVIGPAREPAEAFMTGIESEGSGGFSASGRCRCDVSS